MKPEEFSGIIRGNIGKKKLMSLNKQKNKNIRDICKGMIGFKELTT
jgi:hypothetical protein